MRTLWHALLAVLVIGGWMVVALWLVASVYQINMLDRTGCVATTVEQTCFR